MKKISILFFLFLSISIVDNATSQNIEKFDNGVVFIEYNLDAKSFDVNLETKQLLKEAFVEYETTEVIKASDFTSAVIQITDITDDFGIGKRYDIIMTEGPLETLKHSIYLYEGQRYFLSEFQVENALEEVESNYMSPLKSETIVSLLGSGDNRVLFAPYDNGDYDYYNAFAFGSSQASSLISHEVSAFYNSQNGEGLIIGSITHDTWKTGVQSSTTTNGDLADIKAYGGAVSKYDILPHGAVKGNTIKSPKVFVGYFEDWRDGLEMFAKTNTIIAPRLPWNSNIPMAWNSWAVINSKVNFNNTIEVSDYFTDVLQPQGFGKDKVVYIGLDAFWNDNFSESQLKAFTDHCKANGQKAGIYWAPFVYYFGGEGNIMEGSTYTFGEALLRANGAVLEMNGGRALDPSHPGTKARNKYKLDKFKEWGFEWVKIDFTTHGHLESDTYSREEIQTATQAYNDGMAAFAKDAKGMYISFGVSPTFPYQHVHSRKISTDAFGYWDETERIMNAINYGWWLSEFYHNDADHIVLDAPYWNTRVASEGENRMRITNSVVTGVFLQGDDFSSAGPVVAKQRAEKFTTNKIINEIALLEKSFRPLKGNSGINKSTNIFFQKQQDTTYVAVFNFSGSTQNFNIDFNELGLSIVNKYYLKEAFSEDETFKTDTVSVSVPSRDAKVFKMYSPPVDANGDIVISPNNFILSGSTPTCANVNNGKITITNASTYIFDVIVSGPSGYNKTFEKALGTNQLEILELELGEYRITFRLSENSETLFEGYVVKIDDAPSVTGKLVSKDQSSKTAIYKVSGDKKYTVLVNYKHYADIEFSDTKSHNITVPLAKGNNVIKIVPKNTCRGVIKGMVSFDTAISVYPNPTTKAIQINGLKANIIGLQLFDVRGKLIHQKNYKIPYNVIDFSIEEVPAGLYFLKVITKTNETSHKIIKQ